MKSSETLVLNSKFLMQILGKKTELELFKELNINYRIYKLKGLCTRMYIKIVDYCKEKIIDLEYVFIQKKTGKEVEL